VGTQGGSERAVEAAVRGYLARRFRRIGPGLVFAGVLVLVLALVPPRGGGRGSLVGLGSSGTGQGGGGTGANATTSGPGAGGTVASGANGSGGAAFSAGLGGGSGITPAAPPGSAGTAVSGVRCGPGVRQVPWSAYAPWCEPAYHGNNGGATAPGVTGTTITLTYRIADSGESKAVFAAAGQAGNATDQQYVQDMQSYVGLLNRQYELYGRHVVLKPYHGQSDWLQEDQGQDLNGAQADAATARDLGALADVSVYSATEPYGADLATDHVITTSTVALPASWYAERAPYAYNANPTNTSFAEYSSNLICQRANGLPAIFAGDASMRTKQRVFGLLVPENPYYSSGADRFESRLHQCGASVTKRINYALNIETAQQQASSAMAQMRSAGVTTVLCACDPIAPIFDTRAADQQGYHPEWNALWWGDPIGRDYSQGQWAHATASAGASPNAKATEAYQAYKLANPSGEPAEMYFPVPYEYMLYVFDALQAAGPDLTPQTFEQGMFSLPPTPAGLFGPWSYGQGAFSPRTAFQVGWWDPAYVSAYDNKKGGYRDCEGGRYFPADDPSAYGSPHTQLHCFGQ
jgi:hypothetical protein